MIRLAEALTPHLIQAAVLRFPSKEEAMQAVEKELTRGQSTGFGRGSKSRPRDFQTGGSGTTLPNPCLFFVVPPSPQG
jgi:hypothetical protein